VGISGSARGHEAAQVASAWALRPGVDVVYPYYRDIGVALTLGISSYEIFLGLLDRASDPFSGARQMPLHWTSARLRMPSPSTSIATQIPHAVGAALASKLRGEDSVTIVYFGDGATSKGDFHEAANFAAVHQLPVVFFCENNQYAISVPANRQMPGGAAVDKAAAYRMPGERIDGNDAAGVYRRTLVALKRARSGMGPTFIEAVVYRLGPHTSHDDDTRYRSRREVQEWEAREPVARLRATLLADGVLGATADDEIVAVAKAEVDEALARAELAPAPDPRSAFEPILHGVTVADPFTRDGRARVSRDTAGVRSTGTVVEPA
jgi:2-oxoisovalerate dehydrogenase E1 component alpha subunit